jgi:hypothetical protein
VQPTRRTRALSPLSPAGTPVTMAMGGEVIVTHPCYAYFLLRITEGIT